MYAVYGTLTTCAGVLLFFLMLHLHRRPGVARWLETRAVGEITVWLSMMVVLLGTALVGRFGVEFESQTFGLLEAAAVVASLFATGVIVWKTYLPIPGESQPAPVVGIDGGKPDGAVRRGSSAAARNPRKAA